MNFSIHDRGKSNRLIECGINNQICQIFACYLCLNEYINICIHDQILRTVTLDMFNF